MIEENDIIAAKNFALTLSDILPVEAVIVYGSVARGKPGDTSDLDVMIVINDSKPEKYTAAVTKAAIETSSARDIKPILTNLQDINPEFLKNVLREGRVVFGKLVVEASSVLKPMNLIIYTTKKLKKSVASRISQIVHGYTTKKTVGKKEYISEKPGMGWAVARGAIILSPEKAEEFEKILKKHKAEYTTHRIWI